MEGKKDEIKIQINLYNKIKKRSMIKKLLKKITIFYLMLWVWFWGGWYYYFFIKQSSEVKSWVSSSTYEIVASWSLSQSITVVWNAELTDEQQLKFNKTGKVTAVYIKEWDSVKKDDLIAELDKSQALINIEQQQLNIENAKLKLQDLYKPLDASKIMEYEKNISQAEDNIEVAKKELDLLLKTQETSIQNLEKNIEYKKKDIEILEKSLLDAQESYDVTIKEQQKSLTNTEIEIQNTFDMLLLDFKKELTGIAENIETIDYILWYTEANKTKNDVFEIYLSAKDLTLKNQAEIYFSQAISSYQKALQANDNDIRNLLSLEKELFDNMYYASDYTYKALENSVEAASLTANEISSKKSSMSSIRSKMQSWQATVLSYEKKLDTLTDIDLVKSSQQLALEKSVDTITSIKNNLEKGKNDLKNLEKNLIETLEDNKLKLISKQNSIKNLQTGLEITKKTYQEALEWPTTTNVINLQNEIKKAELNLSDAKKELDNFELRAPFSWIIRKVDLQVGDNLASDNSKYVYIENPDLIEIPVLLDQVDIVKVSIWQKATITFDAYPTEKVEWEIQLIDYTPVQSSWVVSYTIKIVITDEKFDKKVLSWMTADIEIITLEKNDVLVVSTKAISTQDNKSYVSIEKNGKIQKVEIEIGTASSWKTEILSWLSLGDKIVITEIKTTNSSNTSSSTNSLITLPWWGGNNRTTGGWFWWWPWF